MAHVFRTSVTTFAVTLLMLAGSLAAGPVTAGKMKRGSNPLWFGNCEFEAQRYFTCRSAAPEVEEHIIALGGRSHPGVALTAYVKAHFETSGCSYHVEAEAFRVNGVFFSFDSRAFESIRCPGQGAKPKFSPDKATVLDHIEFWFDLPPL